MKIIKIEETDGRKETKGCGFAASEIIRELKNVWMSEDYKVLDYVLVKKNADLYIGGDHSVSYRCFKESNCNGLLVFDAHPDVYQEFDQPTHLDWLKFLVDEGKVDSNRVVLVGLRNFHPKEIKYLNDKGIKYITMKQIYDVGVNKVCDSVMELVNGFEKLYMSIDIDVVDPAYAPGVGYREPGGLSSREMIYFIQRLKNLKNLKKVDIVEVNLEKDTENRTVKLASKLIWELI